MSERECCRLTRTEPRVAARRIFLDPADPGYGEIPELKACAECERRALDLLCLKQLQPARRAAKGGR